MDGILHLKKSVWYEVPICVHDEEGRLRIWYPDFYLPKLGIYIEVCGTERGRKEKIRRKHVFEENEIPVVFLHYYKSDKDWGRYLESEINSIERGRLYESKKLKPIKWC